MQAVAQLIDQLTAQLSAVPAGTRGGLLLKTDWDQPDSDLAVIDPALPSTPRWSESPICGSGDDVDEDEAYFLGEEDEDDDDDDDYDDDDDDDLDDDDDELDTEPDVDEDDF